MKKLVVYALALAACTMALSCGSQSVSLSGDWIFDTVDGEKVSAVEKTPFLSFDEAEKRVHGCLGVNVVNGSYTFKGDSLKFSPMASTMMAGLPQDMELEGKLGAALVKVATVEFDGNSMSLKDAAGELVLTLVKSETPLQTD